MKTPLLTLLLLAAPAFAFAQSVEPAARNASSQQDPRQGHETQADQDALRDCVRFTGSRIVRNRAERNAQTDTAEKIGELDHDDCIAANGRVYSRRDLQRTGKTDIADALRMLDPAIH